MHTCTDTSTCASIHKLSPTQLWLHSCVHRSTLILSPYMHIHMLRHTLTDRLTLPHPHMQMHSLEHSAPGHVLSPIPSALVHAEMLGTGTWMFLVPGTDSTWGYPGHILLTLLAGQVWQALETSWGDSYVLCPNDRAAPAKV